MSALEMIQSKISRRTLLRGTIAAVPMAAIPAGLAVASSTSKTQTPNDAVLRDLYGRAMQTWHEMLDAYQAGQFDTDESMGKAAAIAEAMVLIPSDTREAAQLKIHLASHEFQGRSYTLKLAAFDQLHECAERELAALSGEA